MNAQNYIISFLPARNTPRPSYSLNTTDQIKLHEACRTSLQPYQMQMQFDSDNYPTPFRGRVAINIADSAQSSHLPHHLIWQYLIAHRCVTITPGK